MSKRTTVLFSSLFMAASLITVSANSAMKYWHGSSGNGTVSSDQDCPLTVEHEDLSFFITDVPDTYFDSIEMLSAYRSYVQADYTFRNPTDMTVTSRLVFPFGIAPSYLEVKSLDTLPEAYTVAVNGIPAETKLRCTYQKSTFDVTRDIDMLRDGYYDDPFYSPDLPVNHLVYTAADLPESDHSVLAFEMANDPMKTRLYLEDANSWNSSAASLRTGAFVSNGDTLDLWILGEMPETLPQWKGYEDLSLEKETEGKAELTSSETMTMYEAVFRSYDPESGILENDWYNAWVSLLNAEMTAGGLIGELPRSIESRLMRWYDYEITLEPGETVINSVRAPLWPSRDDAYEPPVFEYTYLLSPASTWSSFGDLDVDIHTQLYMVRQDETFAFEKTDDGYHAHLDGLPDKELVFSLSASEEMHHAADKGVMLFLGILLGAAILFLVIFILVIRLIVKLIRKR